MKKKSRQPLLIVTVFFLLTTLLPVAKANANQKKNETLTWWGEVKTGFIYDNNILQVDNNKESDIIWESALFFAIQAEEIEWHGLAIFDRYSDNSELNSAYYEIGAERALDQIHYGSFSLNLSPTSALDKQDPNRAPFSLGSYGFDLSVERDTELFGTIAMDFSYTRLDYEAPFNAKDSHLVALNPSLFYRINNALDFFGEYTYTWGKARRGFIPVGINGIAFDDISFTANTLSLAVAHRISEKTRVRLRYKIRRKRFTPNIRDIFHRGRKDTTHLLSAEVKQHLLKNVLLRGRVEHLFRRSNQAFVDFRENRLTASVIYQF